MKSVEEATSIGVDLIGMLRTNIKGFFKAKIEGLMKDWPGRYYIVLKSNPMVLGERSPLAIRYRYNS